MIKKLKRAIAAWKMDDGQWFRTMCVVKMSPERWNDMNMISHLSEDQMIAATTIAGYKPSESQSEMHNRYNTTLKLVSDWLEKIGVSLVYGGVEISSERNYHDIRLIQRRLAKNGYAQCVRWMRKAGYKIEVPARWQEAVSKNEQMMAARHELYNKVTTRSNGTSDND